MDQIPRIIHQTWKTGKIPGEFEPYATSWISRHPLWEYKLWTDEDIRNFFPAYYPWFIPQFNAYKRPIERIDAFRYFLLHQFGGFYIDIDFECLKPLDPLINGRRCILGTEPGIHARRLYQKERLICNAILASTPGHRFWEHVFLMLGQFKNKPNVIESSGPLLLQHAYLTYPGKDVAVFPETVFCPLVDLSSKRLNLSEAESAYYTNMLQNKAYPAESYAVHHWAGSWCKWGMMDLIQLIKSYFYGIKYKKTNVRGCKS